jgi:predicted nucleic acid-binding protein
MKKLKLYLDTSIPSFLFADDSPEKREATVRFWELLKLNLYDVFISDVLFSEIGNCPQPMKDQLEDSIGEIEATYVSVSKEADELAQQYIHYGIIPEKYYDDALHIAIATLSGCDAILSWNFRHIVKLKTIRGIGAINRLMGYPEIQILTPQSWLEEDDNG